MSEEHKKSSRKGRPSRIDYLLDDALASAGMTDGIDKLRMFMLWEEAVGPSIARKTSPLSYARGVLVVRSVNAAWQNELTYLKNDIVNKVNKLAGKKLVEELKIVGGHYHQEKAKPLNITPPVPKPNDDEYAAAEATSKLIGDPEVREAFQRAMAQYLAAMRDR